MHTLLRLPLILLEMALRQGAGTVKDILRRVSGGGEGNRAAAAPAPPDPRAARREAEALAAAEARARRPEARPRAAARRRPAPAPAPAPPEPAPTHVASGAETVASFGPADDPSPRIDVQAPWNGYDSQPAAEVIRRIRAGDEATKAVALLYERGRKARASVIRAAGG
jgi:hypothetical protein